MVRVPCPGWEHPGSIAVVTEFSKYIFNSRSHWNSTRLISPNYYFISQTYTAAIMEYAPIHPVNTIDDVLRNTREYTQFMSNARNRVRVVTTSECVYHF